MILKYLILAAVIYGIYRFSNAKSLKSGHSDLETKNNSDDEDYIEYEEVE